MFARDITLALKSFRISSTNLSRSYRTYCIAFRWIIFEQLKVDEQLENLI